MKNQSATLIMGVFLLCLLVAIGVAAVAGACIAVLYLDPTVTAAIIAGGVTVVVAVLTVVLGKIYESRAAVDREHREKKIPVYEDLIKFMSKVLVESKQGTPVSEKEMLDFMAGFTQRLMVWGSDEVVACWVKWRRAAARHSEAAANPIAVLLVYEELIFAMRKDLGHSKKLLGKGDILATFVNDIDAHLAVPEEKKHAKETAQSIDVSLIDGPSVS